MCKVSDKLKLCTCKTEATRLKNYWIFHRWAKFKDNQVVGQFTLPRNLFIKPDDDAFNQNLLLKLLNGGNVFDVDMKPRQNDRLQLAFAIGRRDKDTVHYGFAYKKGKWVYCQYDFLTWMWKHDEEKQGKIAHALERADGA